MAPIKRTLTFFPVVGILFFSGCSSIQLNSREQLSPSLKILSEFQKGFPLPAPRFVLADPGSPGVVDYSLFGEVKDAGTESYRYVIRDAEGLKKAVGAGTYPNEDGILRDPEFKKYKDAGLIKGSAWDALNDEDLQRAFYVWTRAYHEDKGVKTFFTALLLEKSGHILQAIKTYYAGIIHFPRSACFAKDGSFVWYTAPVAMTHLKRLCRDYPDLDLEYVDGFFSILNGQDIDLSNDIIHAHPGVLVKKMLVEKKNDLRKFFDQPVIETRGDGQVQLVRFQNGHWQLRADGEPFFIRGISYMPTEIGLGSDALDQWMFSDKNKNGKIDGPYEAWADLNGNGRQDKEEAAVGDFQLMKDIGVNAIRLYIPNKGLAEYDPARVNKVLLRKMKEHYGIWVVAGDFLGAYTLGSGASWQDGTDYTDPEQRRKMKETVRAKVMDLKDEPFILMWLLGNENNMASDYMGVNAARTNARRHPEAYAKFLQEVALMIHELDPNHPVAVGNVETGLLEYYQQFSPAIDIIGVNSYQGSLGFGGLWQEAKTKFDRPVLITEYGCDAYFQGRGEDEDSQEEYHRGNFRDIIFNQAGGPGEGNAIGGMIFEYLDEWWKDTRGDPNDSQQPGYTFPFPFPDGHSHEEWLGIISQGSGKNSPFERRPRKAYYFYKETAR
ncbi:MAG: glycoside hydrolase family 2 TIM barrel-domain containing protein [Candidatus Omnitrophota bacterium]